MNLVMSYRKLFRAAKQCKFDFSHARVFRSAKERPGVNTKVCSILTGWLLIWKMSLIDSTFSVINRRKKTPAKEIGGYLGHGRCLT